MKRVGIFIDKWKLPIFKKRLTEGGFEYKKKPGLTKGTLNLIVNTDAVESLKKIVEEAQLECATHGKTSH